MASSDFSDNWAVTIGLALTAPSEWHWQINQKRLSQGARSDMLRFSQAKRSIIDSGCDIPPALVYHTGTQRLETPG